jgi:hypothetical protein
VQVKKKKIKKTERENVLKFPLEGAIWPSEKGKVWRAVFSFFLPFFLPFFPLTLSCAFKTPETFDSPRQSSERHSVLECGVPHAGSR